MLLVLAISCGRKKLDDCVCRAVVGIDVEPFFNGFYQVLEGAAVDYSKLRLECRGLSPFAPL
jgi:hypothetical protein